MKHGKSVAIVGVGGLFPMSPTLDRFWENITGNISTAGKPPEGRWLLEPEEIFDPQIGAADKVYSQKACFIDDEADVSTIPGLEIEPEFLAGLDPLYRLLLHAGHQAFSDAVVEKLDRERTGVIIGNLALPSEKSSALARETLGRAFEEKLFKQPAGPPENPVASLNRYVAGLPAGLLAKALGLKGCSFTLDAACASSLYAIKLAVDELLTGRADAMLTGGLSRPDSLYTQMGFSQLRALSPTGTCSPFDQRGDGLVVGEGCGMLLLKRTEDAVRDGDHIYAVIRAIGLSNDLGGSLLAPASEGQLRAMRSAYKQAGWKPSDVDLIECHATGTPVGDAVEFSSLNTLWGEKDWRTGQCVIGSVKSNIGHLLTAAGSAALIKTLLALKNEQLPPTANYSNPAQGVEIENSPFRILNTPCAWKRRKPGVPRRAAISAFGFGGINAHLLIEEWLPQKPEKKTLAFHPTFKKKSAPIAIVGIGAHFGPWDSVSKFRQRVFGRDDGREPTAPNNWWGAESNTGSSTPAGVKGYFVPEVSSLPGEFRIPPTEQAEMLPRQLLMLKVAGQALQDAGLTKEDLLFSGVYIGTGLDLNATNFSFRWGIQRQAGNWAEKLGLSLTEAELSAWIESLRNTAGPALTANRTMGALGSIVASRIAKEFRVGGPSFTLSNEENSGLRALEVGIHALQEGSINRAIVGAADMAGDLRSVLGQHSNTPYSPGGKIRPFDKDADGTIVGEGAAAVILKRLEDAKQDGDHIYAVLKGIGTATGGQVESAQPAKKSYSLALDRTFQDARISPASVSYLETNGSGVPTEDGLEANCLSAVIGSDTNQNHCRLGSVKADIGHAGSAAGLASLVKMALCLDQKILPPVRYLNRLRYEWIRSTRRFSAPEAPQYWLRNRADGPRRALVSSFGVDGTCSHALLEEYVETGKGSPKVQERPLGAFDEGLFALEAGSPVALLEKISTLQEFLATSETTEIEQLAALWLNHSPLDPQLKHCLALVASNLDELLIQLEHAAVTLQRDPKQTLGPNAAGGLSAAIRDRVFYSPDPLTENGKLAFVFPGSGNHFAGMGRDLSVHWPEIFNHQDQSSQYLKNQYQPEHFWRNSLKESIHEDHNALVISHVALCTAISDLLRSFNIEPQVISGYSLGESAGLFSSGSWQDRDGMLTRLKESTLFTEDLAGQCKAVQKTWGLPAKSKVDWLLGIVNAPAAEIRKHLQSKTQAYLLIINTHREAVIGGDQQQVEQLVKELGCHFIPLRGVTTVHCEVVKPVAKPYRDLHLFETTPPAGITNYSCALGTSYQVTTESAADVILAQALDTVDYTRVIEQAYADGVRIFIEAGPGNSCSRMIGSILEGRPHLVRPSCVAGQNAASMILRLLAQCLAERVPVDLDKLYPMLPGEKQPGTAVKRIMTTIGGAAFEPQMPVIKPPENPLLQPESAIPAAAAPAEEEMLINQQPSAGNSSSLTQWTEALALNAATHETYLNFSRTMEKTLAENISLQMSLLQQLTANGERIPTIQPLTFQQSDGVTERQSPAASSLTAPPAKPVAFDREMCLEFAIGSVARMLGPDFSEVDSYPTRVRLPDEPLMLVDRIMSVEGEPRSMTSGRVVTEHDVTSNRWYLDGGRIPTCIAVEAGQADLFLSGYLGIDFISKGKAVYRLLDAVVTFHRGLPVVGETIHYDIRIERFFRQDQTYLFRFNFEATVNGEPLLSMKNGCAGFFTAEELAAGQGIIHTRFDLLPQPGTRPDDWQDLVPMQRESYNDQQVNALYAGDLIGCFGPTFSALPLRRPFTLPGGRLKLVDRVIDLDPSGGRYGIGQIRAEMDISPDDWFLTCHFVDDRVMPGTLMYECCMHTLRIYLLRMGWIGETDSTWCEPVPGVDSGLKCRGQVTETTRTVTYQVNIKELGYRPEPYAIVDALMFADGKPIVEIPNMSIRLSGLSREMVEGLWHKAATVEGHAQTERIPLYDYDKILAYSTGNPSEAFGEPYKIFDQERKIARLPGPPFQFLDRIVAVTGEPFKLAEGATCEAEYDVPTDAWYFQAGRQAEMPFSVLLETGLQPCGWLAAYLGSALTSSTDLKFRNLDGNAVQLRPVTAASGTLTTKVKITRISSSGGMIIQGYDFEISDHLGPVYTGDTVFGFFSAESLAQQVGVRGAELYSPAATEVERAEQFPYPTEPPFPEARLRMVDHIDLYVADGGPKGLGFIRGTKKVDPDEWFFKAHFYQDPVCPGSLGLESFLQLLKVVAVKRWGGDENSRLETIAISEKHSWNYRGQIIPANNQVQIEAQITSIDEQQQLIKANGYLSVDGKIIYQLHDFSLRFER